MDADLRSSLSLLALAQSGDRAALDLLLARYRPRLERWAAGRLPRWARDAVDTQDLVQDALLQTFRGIEHFDARGNGALFAYLRQAILNRIRDELRRAKRRPAGDALDVDTPSADRSPLEEAIGRESLERYEQALATLTAQDREAIVARVELGCSHQEVADLLGKPTANAARMTVERAIVRLAKAMRPAFR